MSVNYQQRRQIETHNHDDTFALESLLLATVHYVGKKKKTLPGTFYRKKIKKKDNLVYMSLPTTCKQTNKKN